MEALFVNKFETSKELTYEAAKAYRGKKFFIYQIVLFATFLVLAALWIFELADVSKGISTLALGIIFWMLPIILDRYNAKKNEKRFLLLYNKLPESTTYFFNNNLLTVNDANNGELKVEYDKIIKIKQSKNLYLLILKEKMYIMVDKNRFEKGTCEEFEEFIKAKAVNAKIKL